MKKPAPSTLAERIVDAALARGARRGWARVRLHDVARDLGVPLGAIYAHYRDLDAVGEALFARADRALLAAAEARGFDRRAARDRVERLFMAWIATLAPHRRQVRDHLRYKFAAAHVHLRAALIVRLSRTIQWVREAARFDASGLRHDVEEIGLTLLFVATVLAWLGDTSDGLKRTRAFLARSLSAADRLMAQLFPPRPAAGKQTRRKRAGKRYTRAKQGDEKRGRTR